MYTASIGAFTTRPRSLASVALRHGVGREHVLAVGALQQHVRRHQVDAGVAPGGVLDHEQRGDGRLSPGAVSWMAAR